MQTVIKLALASISLAIAWQIGSPRETSPAPKPTSQPARVPTTGRYDGMAVQLHGGVGIYDAYHRLVPEVAALGADSILFCVHGWQEHAGSLDLHLDAKRTADTGELGRLCDLAAANNLRVILMPMVLLTNPRNNEWRGKIVPENKDWKAWFDRYREFITHFARIAEKHRVDVLMIGSELVKTEGRTEEWRGIIADVRKVFHGRLGYSANWDHYQTEKIGFWKDLDFVGMTTYYKLAEAANPTVEEVDKNWARIKKEILTFQAEVDRPIIFTEAGWCSQEGAAYEAWNYYHSQKATEAGRKEQTLCYEAFLRAWADEPAVGGIIWWEWDLSPGGNEDYNYTPKGKPAESILRKWFEKSRSANLLTGPTPKQGPGVSGAVRGGDSTKPGALEPMTPEKPPANPSN